MPKFSAYAVAAGFGGPCICTNWDACHSRVNGFPSSMFKGFKTMSEAHSYMEANGHRLGSYPTDIVNVLPASQRSVSKSSENRHARQRSPSPTSLGRRPPQSEAKIHQGPLRNLIMHFDGGCTDNGSSFAKGGYGAWFKDADTGYDTNLTDISEPLLGSVQTNNRGELMGAIAGVEKATLKAPGSNVHVRGDSVYVLKGIKTWIETWKRNGWRTAAKKPVENQDLWIRFDAAVQKHEKSGGKISWEHIPRELNGRADRLATEGIARH